MLNKKTLQTCKPDPVIPINRDCHHLSVPVITHRDQSAYPVSWTSSPQTILYVAFQHARFTRKWCHHQKLWAFTPHFHLFSAKGGVVIFCGTICYFNILFSIGWNTRLFTGALLCTVQTFLLPHKQEAIARFAAKGKFTFKMWISIQKIFRWRHNQNEGHIG